jgi:hypothetical protein
MGDLIEKATSVIKAALGAGDGGETFTLVGDVPAAALEHEAKVMPLIRAERARIAACSDPEVAARLALDLERRAQRFGAPPGVGGLSLEHWRNAWATRANELRQERQRAAEAERHAARRRKLLVTPQDVLKAQAAAEAARVEAARLRADHQRTLQEYAAVEQEAVDSDAPLPEMQERLAKVTTAVSAAAQAVRLAEARAARLRNEAAQAEALWRSARSTAAVAAVAAQLAEHRRVLASIAAELAALPDSDAAFVLRELTGITTPTADVVGLLKTVSASLTGLAASVAAKVGAKVPPDSAA